MAKSKRKQQRAPAAPANLDPFQIEDSTDDGPSTGGRPSPAPSPGPGISADDGEDKAAAATTPAAASTSEPSSAAPTEAPAKASDDTDRKPDIVVSSESDAPKLPPKAEEQESTTPKRHSRVDTVEDDEPWGAAPQVQPSTAAKAAEMARTGSATSHAGATSLSAHKATSNPIEIIEALKSSDGAASSTFIVYHIRSGSFESKRRYSEFEALRSALVSLHPTSIVPPLPPKHTLSDYAAGKSKAKEDPEIIGRRRRMLATFLNRVANHDTLGKSIVFQRFLDGRWQWHEIAASPPLSILPKNNLRAPARDPADPNASPAYLALPLPTSATPLRNPNQRFIDSEAFTNRFANHLTNSLEKANRRVVRRWGDSATDYLELGAVLNGFSLSESGSLAAAIERTGQAADGTNLITGAMLQEWETTFTERLHEYGQFAAILQKLLKWRHLKHLQYELAEDALEAKRLKLEELERIEREAGRLNAALESGGRTLGAGGGVTSQSGGAGREGVYDSVNARSMKSSIFGAAAEEEEQEGGSGGNVRTSSAARPGSQDKADPSGSVSSVVSAGGGKSVAAEHLGDSADWTVPSAVPSPPSLSAPTSRNGPSHSAPRGRGRGSGPPGSGSGDPSSAPSSRGGARGGFGRKSTSSGGGSSGGGGLLGALSHTFQSVMDVDPEATRRNNMGRLRENIAQLDEALQLTAADLRWATGKIQGDLDRFQKQKVLDFREMMLNFAKMHREFCRANLANWQDARSAIDMVATQGPMPESSLVGHPGGAGGGGAGASGSGSGSGSGSA